MQDVAISLPNTPPEGAEYGKTRIFSNNSIPHRKKTWQTTPNFYYTPD